MKRLTISSTLKRIFGLTVIGLFTSSVALAIPVYDTFGPLPALTAGGTTEKNAAISTGLNGALTLGLSAQQRYSNPPLTDDGEGTFFAGTGQNNGLSGSHPQGALWNFDFYINNTSTTKLTYSIAYGLVGGTVYTFDPTPWYSDQSFQDSQNLMFSNFGFFGPANGFASSFDPNANADYEFLLTATDKQNNVVAASGINVRVGTGSSLLDPGSPVPDTGSTCMMLGFAFAGIASLRRKFAA